MLNGYTLLRMDKDRKNPQYDIYIFQKEDGLETMIDQYKVQYGR